MANNSGGAAFLYCIHGWIFTKLQEEIPPLKDNLTRNTLAGFTSGVIYKCTKGFTASMIGGMIGGCLVAALTYATDEMRRKEMIRFEMNFDD